MPKRPRTPEYAEQVASKGHLYGIIAIDGRNRVECAKHAVAALANRSVMLGDNTDRDYYREGYDHLRRLGFRRVDFWGTSPIITTESCTSVFYRDGNTWACEPHARIHSVSPGPAVTLRDLAIDFAPPKLRRAVLRWRKRGLRFIGRPHDWSEANQLSTGYDAAVILERVAAATRAVLAGQACFERDSVLFDRPAYPFELLTVLLRLALRHEGRLRVLDFGGSLGSSYRQCRSLLDGATSLRWLVVEQDDFVAVGLREFATAELGFARTLDEACAEGVPDLTLASSVLQYMEDPDATLERLAATGARSLLLDRTPLTDAADHSLCIQHVPATIYPASYPCWLLSRERLLARLGSSWRLVCDYPCLDGEWRTDDGRRFGFRGLMLERMP